MEDSFDGIIVHQGPEDHVRESRLYEMLGYSEGELEGIDQWLIYHPDYREIFRQRAPERMRGEEEVFQYEVKLQLKGRRDLFEGEIRQQGE